MRLRLPTESVGSAFANSRSLFQFDKPYLKRHRWVAGVDEAGRGPLAGPVVSAAVILSVGTEIPYLADSKLLLPGRRLKVYQWIQRQASAIGVGIVPHDDIDRLNILQATFASMRLALMGLVVPPEHVMVDGGFVIPGCSVSQTSVVRGDARSACIAAASIVAKVTRDSLMEALDRCFPHYGFRQHKGYGTPQHLEALKRLGPSPIHRKTFRPVVSALA